MIRTTCSNPTTFLRSPFRLLTARWSDKPGLGIELNREKLDAFKRCDVRESVFFDNIEDEQMPLIGQVL